MYDLYINYSLQFVYGLRTILYNDKSMDSSMNYVVVILIKYCHYIKFVILYICPVISALYTLAIINELMNTNRLILDTISIYVIGQQHMFMNVHRHTVYKKEGMVPFRKPNHCLQLKIKRKPHSVE